jgi:putative ABC transport system substrate-binding protein
MRRREFITLVGGAAAGCPLAARAQQGERLRRIGVLMPLAEDDQEAGTLVAAFVKALQEQGWTVGRNVSVDYRWAAGDAQRIGIFAKELIEQNPDLILARSSPVVAALMQQTRTIPVVFFQVVDPVGQGFVTSLARPGGNVTDFTIFEPTIGSKWLELLNEVTPRVDRVALIYNPDTLHLPDSSSALSPPRPPRSCGSPFAMLRRSSPRSRALRRSRMAVSSFSRMHSTSPTAT